MNKKRNRNRVSDNAPAGGGGPGRFKSPSVVNNPSVSPHDLSPNSKYVMSSHSIEKAQEMLICGEIKDPIRFTYVYFKDTTRENLTVSLYHYEQGKHNVEIACILSQEALRKAIEDLTFITIEGKRYLFVSASVSDKSTARKVSSALQVDCYLIFNQCADYLLTHHELRYNLHEYVYPTSGGRRGFHIYSRPCRRSGYASPFESWSKKESYYNKFYTEKYRQLAKEYDANKKRLRNEAAAEYVRAHPEYKKFLESDDDAIKRHLRGEYEPIEPQQSWEDFIGSNSEPKLEEKPGEIWRFIYKTFYKPYQDVKKKIKEINEL